MMDKFYADMTPLYTAPVDAVNTSQERVDEIVKQEHDRAVELGQAYERGWNAALAQQEPVGKFAKFSDGVWKEVTEGSAGVLLYTSPPPRQPLTEWQPIETAPKTGRKVILFYLNRNKLPRTVMARWLTDEEAAETDADDVGLEGGWYECIDNWDDYTEVAIHEGEPSHWMPLPAPPIEAAHGIGDAA